MRWIILLLVPLIILCCCIREETTTTSSTSTTTTTTTTTTTPSTTAPITTITTTTTTSSTTTLLGVVVKIKEFRFEPNLVIISRGETVTWINEDSARHSIVGVGYSSGDLLKGGTYSRTFDKAGNFPYHCGYHPQMKGEVRVK